MNDTVLIEYEGVSEEEKELYKKDKEKFRQMEASGEYRIVENTFATKAGVEYYLKMK